MKSEFTPLIPGLVTVVDLTPINADSLEAAGWYPYTHDVWPPRSGWRTEMRLRGNDTGMLTEHVFLLEVEIGTGPAVTSTWTIVGPDLSKEDTPMHTWLGTGALIGDSIQIIAKYMKKILNQECPASPVPYAPGWPDP